jgi:hypothetical protein
MTELLRRNLEDHELTSGTGKLSAFISIAGILAILTALCFLFPNMLTTPEFRPLYNAHLLRQLLILGILIGFISGVISTLRNFNRRWGLFGMLFNALAALLASGQIEPVYHGRSMYAGLDYFVLTLQH